MSQTKLVDSIQASERIARIMQTSDVTITATSETLKPVPTPDKQSSTQVPEDQLFISPKLSYHSPLVTQPGCRLYWRDRLGGEIGCLKESLSLYPSEDLSCKLDRIALEAMDSMAYTNARNQLLAVEVEHLERCRRLNHSQAQILAFVSKVQEMGDWVRDFRQVDRLFEVNDKLGELALLLEEVRGELPAKELPPLETDIIPSRQKTANGISSGNGIPRYNEGKAPKGENRKKVVSDDDDDDDENGVPHNKVKSELHSPTPKRRKRRRHNSTSSQRATDPTEEDSQDRGPFYTIERIVGCDERPHVGVFYKVQWAGYPGQDTWEPEAEIKAANAHDLILEYKRQWNALHPSNMHWDLDSPSLKTLGESPLRQLPDLASSKKIPVEFDDDDCREDGS
eukprot:Protomagalhaensia_sp_Gyna_25__4741@NODE_467_length_3354_cov_34_778281_g361_i0_p2_GENE_NODE_467_length_3354_cov_34_778281_g361_i0NODE_467_length_3354_cov_34_778281_g361_i0_p2_ORF_typecomplete_len396_score51_63Chromo/PF00385_24/2_7e08_NODE_467_length_3354_cov_34_778281_g361_i04191606